MHLTRPVRGARRATVVGALAATLLSLTAVALTPGPAAAAAGAPATIPALRQWTAGTGSFTFTTASRIVVDPAYATQLDDEAATFAEDLRAATGRTVVVAHGAAVTGDIRLTLGGTGAAEAYTLTVGGSIAIQAATDAGAFYGTRSVLQWLRRSPVIAGGTATDSPSKPERGLMLDVGRKYMSMDFLRRHIKELAYLKENVLHLHVSDNLGFRLESSTHPEVVSADHYTKAQIRELIALAAGYHVTIIPEIDMPGHMDTILAAHPELKLVSNTGAVNNGFIDLAKPAAYTLMRDLINEYLPLFPGPYWHIGADEYITNYAAYPQLLTYAQAQYGAAAKPKDTYYGFINWANDLVRAAGKTTRMWNDGIGNGDGTRTPATNILVEYWYNYGISPQQLLDRGHTITNASWTPTYYVLGGAKPDARWAYETWTPDTFQGGNTITTAARNRGSDVHVWSDNPAAESEDQIAAGIRLILRVVAQQTWGSAKPVTAYTDFVALADAIGRAPGWPVEGTDLALRRPATASSTETAAFPASAAVDGDPGTRWSSSYTDPSWLSVDLGSRQDVARVVLRWEAAYARAYQVQISDNGTTWTTLSSTTAGDGGTDELTVSGTGRYLRVYGTQRASTFGYSLWSVEAYGPVSGAITGTASGRCVDIPGSNSADGTAVALWDCNGGANQTWRLGGDRTLRSLGKCLQPAGGSGVAGTTVVLGTCTGAAYQQWTYDPATREYRTLGACLDARSGATTNGTQIILWSCTGSVNQKWSAPTA
jgi:hexosaminidase